MADALIFLDKIFTRRKFKQKREGKNMLPIQQIAIAGLIKNAADGANNAAKSAREASETLKRIEEQNKETLKRIEAQNIEMRRLKTTEVKNVEINRSSSISSSVMVTCSSCNNQTLRSKERCIICGRLR